MVPFDFEDLFLMPMQNSGYLEKSYNLQACSQTIVVGCDTDLSDCSWEQAYHILMLQLFIDDCDDDVIFDFLYCHLSEQQSTCRHATCILQCCMLRGKAIYHFYSFCFNLIR